MKADECKWRNINANEGKLEQLKADEGR